MHPTKVRHELLQLNGAKMLINGIQNHQSKIIDKIRDISWACCSTIITAAYKNLRLNIMQTTRGFFYTFSRINWVDGIVCYFWLCTLLHCAVVIFIAACVREIYYSNTFSFSFSFKFRFFPILLRLTWSCPFPFKEGKTIIGWSSILIWRCLWTHACVSTFIWICTSASIHTQ